MVTGWVEINYSQFQKFHNRGSPRGSHLPSQAKSTFKFECSVPRLYFSGVPTAWKGSQQTRLLYFPSVSKILPFLLLLSKQKRPQVCPRKKKETVTVRSYFLHPSWKLSLNTDGWWSLWWNLVESPHTSEEAFLGAYSSNQVWFCYFKNFWIFQRPGSLNFDVGRRRVTLSRNLCRIPFSEDLLRSSRNWIGVFVSQDVQLLSIQALSLRAHWK